MSIANRVDCSHCMSSPCKCSADDILNRAIAEREQISYDLYWNDIDNYLQQTRRSD
jgi:hypothetical protein